MAIANVFNSEGGTAQTETTKSKNLSDQIDGSETTFVTPQNFVASSLKVYYNGVRQFTGVSITVATRNSFTTSFVPQVGDYIFVDYKPS